MLDTSSMVIRVFEFSSGGYFMKILRNSYEWSLELVSLDTIPSGPTKLEGL